ncbi:hypothetical protein OAT84_01455 [Gammaproteobacteria bacterium]|nr:hypothetical protein [Gammaproteobacteria bacterium]
MSIFRQKQPSVTLGLWIASTLFVCAVYFSQSTQSQLFKQFQTQYLRQITILLYQADSKSFERLQKDIAQLPEVQNITFISQRRVQVHQKPWQVLTSTFSVLSGQLLYGRGLHPNDTEPYAVAYLPHGYEHSTDYFDISYLTLIPIGQYLLTSTPQMISSHLPILEVSHTTYERLFGPTIPNMILIESENIDQSHVILSLLSKMLEPYHAKIISPIEIIDAQLKSLAQTTFALHVFCAIISLLSILLLIKQNTLMFIHQRKDIALHMALGASQQHMFFLLIKTGLTKALHGLVAALISSSMIICCIAYQQSWDIYIPISGIIGALCINIVVILIGIYLPAKQYFSIPIAHTLKGA